MARLEAAVEALEVLGDARGLDVRGDARAQPGHAVDRAVVEAVDEHVEHARGRERRRLVLVDEARLVHEGLVLGVLGLAQRGRGGVGPGRGPPGARARERLELGLALAVLLALLEVLVVLGDELHELAQLQLEVAPVVRAVRVGLDPAHRRERERPRRRDHRRVDRELGAARRPEPPQPRGRADLVRRGHAVDVGVVRLRVERVRDAVAVGVVRGARPLAAAEGEVDREREDLSALGLRRRRADVRGLCEHRGAEDEYQAREGDRAPHVARGGGRRGSCSRAGRPLSVRLPAVSSHRVLTSVF